MLIDELTPLEETQCGKDLIQVGEERGEKRGEERGFHRAVVAMLEGKYGQIPKTLHTRISRLSIPDSERFAGAVATLSTLREVKEWLDNH